jgi:hypothetical protein
MGAVMNSSDARTLADHIRSIPGLKVVTHEAYGHMGATLVDAVFQAGVSYQHTVVPRVQRLQREHARDAMTTSSFAELLSRADISRLLRWKGQRKITTLQALVRLLLDQGVETESDLVAFLGRLGSKEAVMSIKGLKEKGFAYLRFLAGDEDAVAVDRHLWRTIQEAGIRASSFDEAAALYRKAAAILGLTPSSLEFSVFLHRSSEGR